MILKQPMIKQRPHQLIRNLSINSWRWVLAPLVLTIYLCLCLGLTGCSSLNPFSSDSPASNASVEQTLAPAETARAEASETLTPESAVKTAPTASNPVKPRTSIVEVIWQVPTDAVEIYHLDFGTSETALDNHLKIPVSELEKSNHPRFGPVFRYRLKNIPANQTVYLSLRAENQHGVSQPTPTAKIEPGQQTVSP